MACNALHLALTTWPHPEVLIREKKERTDPTNPTEHKTEQTEPEETEETEEKVQLDLLKLLKLHGAELCQNVLRGSKVC